MSTFEKGMFIELSQMVMSRRPSCGCWTSFFGFRPARSDPDGLWRRSFILRRALAPAVLTPGTSRACSSERNYRRRLFRVLNDCLSRAHCWPHRRRNRREQKLRPQQNALILKGDIGFTRREVSMFPCFLSPPL